MKEENPVIKPSLLAAALVALAGCSKPILDDSLETWYVAQGSKWPTSAEKAIIKDIESRAPAAAKEFDRPLAVAALVIVRTPGQMVPIFNKPWKDVRSAAGEPRVSAEGYSGMCVQLSRNTCYVFVSTVGERAKSFKELYARERARTLACEEGELARRVEAFLVGATP